MLPHFFVAFIGGGDLARRSGVEVLRGHVARVLQLIFRYVLHEVLRDLAQLNFTCSIFSVIVVTLRDPTSTPCKLEWTWKRMSREWPTFGILRGSQTSEYTCNVEGYKAEGYQVPDTGSQKQGTEYNGQGKGDVV